MVELTVDRLRVMLGRETNRAELAERQMRGMAVEMDAMRARIAELQSINLATQGDR